MLTLQHIAEIAQTHSGELRRPVASFRLRETHFGEEPALMGVVNLSPDSWYRESVCLSAEAAIARARRLSCEGARLIDLGAESTLPQAALVDEATQQSLLLPLLRALSSEGILASVETYHPSVARACLEAGASVLNLTRTAGTEEFYRMVADHEAGVIICYIHDADTVRDAGELSLSDDPVVPLREYFARQIDLATAAGVSRIWLDPGMGFYYHNLPDGPARVRHQMHSLLHTFRLRSLGWPVCHALPHAFHTFGEEVRTAESFFAVLALLGQTGLLRTHEVAKVRAVLRTMEAFS